MVLTSPYILLYRERITALGADGKQVHVRSSRLILPRHISKELSKPIVIRSRHLHHAVRLAAALAKQDCKFDTCLSPLEFQSTWESITSGMTPRHQQESWTSIYQGGRVVFERGDRPALLDTLERDAEGDEPTYRALIAGRLKTVAREPLVAADTQVAMIFRPFETNFVVSLLVRSGGANSTFTFSTSAHEHQPRGNVRKALLLAADWLEMLQLTASNNRTGEQAAPASRIRQLSESLSATEQDLRVTYRPERPIMTEAGPLGALALNTYEPSL